MLSPSQVLLLGSLRESNRALERWNIHEWARTHGSDLYSGRWHRPFPTFFRAAIHANLSEMKIIVEAPPTLFPLLS